MTRGLFQRLSYRQARNTVLVALVLSLFATTLQLLYDVERERAAIAGTTRQIAGMVSTAAAKAAYDLDSALCAEVLDGLAGYDPVYQSAITDERGGALAVFRRPLVVSRLRWLSEALFGGSVSIHLPLAFNPPGDTTQPIDVGSLTVAVDSHRIAEAFLERAGATIASGLVSNLLLGLVLGLMFQRTVTTPILAVARGMARIRPDQPDGHRLTVPGGHATSELGYLVNRTNELLERYDATLKEQECTLRDLAAARERAEAASRAKSQFLATISHELRTPLNAIIGFSQIIRDDTPKDGPTAIHADFADEIHESGQHLLSVINDVLDMANLETGRALPKPEPLEVRPLLDACSRMIAPRLEHAGLTMTVGADPDAPLLFADPRAARQMLMHLLSNAVKFTPCGGRVTLASAAVAGGVAISVGDTGVGIESADLPRIFQPFWQAAPVLSRHYEGTGLGLTMVKILVDLHDGRITVDSEPGRGTTVTIVLPDAPASLARRERVTVAAA